MKNVLFVVMAVLFAANLYAQSASVNATASATILTGIGIAKNEEAFTGGDLLFGTLIPSTSSGTVTIAAQSDASSSRSITGGVTGLSYSSSTSATKFGPAAFVVSGQPSYAYTLTIPTSSISILNGTNSMVVSNWTCSKNTGSNTLPSEGSDNFYVGGKLTVGAQQTAGYYSGEFTVTVNY